ncbi:MAG TPA: diaminopimelate epimerase [Polyangia bacterium]|nr:diaminopimelate epimerase [Polyangia bacterium]
MLRFAKYHGLGNDFIVIDEAVSARAATLLCDRRFGVGADGVLMVLPAPAAGADARMRILNADGSEPEMCGNGIRCVAKELFDSGRVRKDVIRIDTLAGVLACAVQVGESGRVDTVAVEMGRPRLTRERAQEPLAIGGRELALTCVSMGNPHAITFVSGEEPLRPLAERLGPLVEHHEWFPMRTNVEFARVRSSGAEIELVVWERGCGITMACGTGACATAAAAVLTGRAPAGREIAVDLPGGRLGITVAEDGSGVRMRGPARLAFRGECDLEALARG